MREDEDKLQELHPEQRLEWDALRKENERIGECRDLRAEVEQLGFRVNEYESRLRAEPLRLRFQEVRARKGELVNRVRKLEGEVREGLLSIPEQRELLLGKVKETNREIGDIEGRIKEGRNEVDNYRRQLNEVRESVEAGKGEQQKYWEMVKTT